MVKYFALAGLTATYIFLIGTFVKIYKADVFYKNAQTVQKAQKAVKLNPQEPNYYRGVAKFLITTDKKAALENLQRSYELNPINLATIRNNIPLYYFLAVKDFQQPAGQDNVDSTFLEITRDYFKFVKQEYPTDLGALVQLANYEKKLGLTGDYEETVETIRNLRPDILDWHPAFN